MKRNQTRIQIVKKKLSLRTNTLRVLSDTELAAIGGGDLGTRKAGQDQQEPFH
jgi:hypothetical protein